MCSKKMYTKNKCLLVIISMYCAAAQANGFKGNLSATSLFSDNALKTQDNPIEERQSLYEAGLSGDYSNWLIEAEAKYDWVAHQYSEKSQPDERFVEGNSSVVFGKEDDPLALQLNHSRRTLLNAPDAVAISQNQQEREMISVAPEFRAKIFSADRLFLSGEYVRVSFPEKELQNSERNGAAVGWLHPLSHISFLRLNARQQKINFEYFPVSDYVFSNAMLAYGVGLRKLKYSVEVGYNQTEPEAGDKQGAPSYILSVNYLSGFNQFDLSVSRVLTDTSFGNGNLEGTPGLPGGDGLTETVDRMDRTSMDLSWQSQAVCTRCQFFIGISGVEDDYLEKDETSLSVYTRARFTYSVSTSSNISVGVAMADVDFDNQQLVRDYKLNTISVDYVYYFDNGIGARVGARNEDREAQEESADGYGTYEENIYSIGLTYKF